MSRPYQLIITDPKNKKQKFSYDSVPTQRIGPWLLRHCGKVVVDLHEKANGDCTIHFSTGYSATMIGMAPCDLGLEYVTVEDGMEWLDGSKTTCRPVDGFGGKIGTFTILRKRLKELPEDEPIDRRQGAEEEPCEEKIEAFFQSYGDWCDEHNGCVDPDGKYHRGLFGGHRDPY